MVLGLRRTDRHIFSRKDRVMPVLLFPIDPCLALIVLFFAQAVLPLASVMTGLYFVFIFLCSPQRPKIQLPTEPPDTRILVLIPCRNEESVIGRLLANLRQINYPAELIDFYVIADNCTDNTAAVARNAGFKVLVRHNLSGQSKAHALHWAFYDQGMLDAGFDAITFLDADTVVDRDFFLYTADSIKKGANVIQTNRVAFNAGQTFLTSAMSIIYSFENRLWYLPHANRGLSTTMTGTGCTIVCEHLRNVGWDIRTLVEDCEFAIQTVLSGSKVTYCDAAKCYVELPPNVRMLWRQLRRWFSGHIACGRFYLPALWNKFRHERGGHASIFMVTLIIPFTCTLGLFQLILSLIAMWNLLGGRQSIPELLCGIIINQIIGMLGAVIILLLDGRLNRKNFPGIWKGIICFPYWSIFLGIIYLTSFIKPKRKWVPMEHNLARFS